MPVPDSSIAKLEASLLVDARATLGECPRWDEDLQRLIWIDIRSGRLNLLDPETAQTVTHEVGQEIGSVALHDDGSFFVAVRNGFGTFHPHTGFRLLVPVEATEPTSRLNDGVADPEGRFWAGSMRDGHEPGLSALYRVELDGGVSTMLTGVGLSNGLAWAPDGSTMWYSDSLCEEVREYGFADNGDLTGPLRRVRIPREWGLPDGIAIDFEGAIWVAIWQGSAVYRFSPEGEMLARVDLPVPRVTACAFGGRDGEELFITTARGATQEPEVAGGLYVCRPGVAGPPARRTKIRYHEILEGGPGGSRRP